MIGTSRLTWCYAVCVMVSWLAGAALAEDAPVQVEYARVYTAIIRSPAADATLDDLAQIARGKGSVEIVRFPADGDACSPTSRTLVSLGQGGFAYPGFSVRAEEVIAKKQAAGELEASSDGKVLSARFQTRQGAGVMEMARPDGKGAPLRLSARVAGKTLATTAIHPAAAKGDSTSRPGVIETDVPGKGIKIVQVYEYLDAAPSAEELAPPTIEGALTPGAAGAGAEADGGAVATDDVSFDASLTGVTWSWDTKWWPGGNEEPGGSPLQIRIVMGVGADIGSHVEGDFSLDYTPSVLQAGAGSGDLAIDFGAELSARGSVDIGIVDPFTFDIPYIPQFDLRIDDEATFDSYLLDSSVHVEDATGRQRVVDVDLVDILLANLIDIPGLSGGISIDAALSASADMTADSISLSDGTTFTSEGESQGVTIGIEGYQATATYNENFTGTATLIAYPVMFVELLWWDWDLPLFDLPWDVISGPIDLDFSTSGLDFPPVMCSLTISEINGTWGEVILDPPPADANSPEYPAGTVVTLSAEPVDGKYLAHWMIFNPDYPGDENHVVYDANSTTTILMDADREVTAAWRCGSGLGGALPLLVVMVALLGVISHRRRRA
ncbi:MAG: hypothetical protein JXQ73_10525 [Phycisphaerae bacterium]|nr:hypothetical protein [Phycisphaerae bacterium]